MKLLFWQWQVDPSSDFYSFVDANYNDRLEAAYQNNDSTVQVTVNATDGRPHTFTVDMASKTQRGARNRQLRRLDTAQAPLEIVQFSYCREGYSTWKPVPMEMNSVLSQAQAQGITGRVEVDPRCWFDLSLMRAHLVVANTEIAATLRGGDKAPTVTPQTSDEEAELVDVPLNSSEAQVVFHHWTQTMPRGRITKIEKVHNPPLRKQYEAHKSSLSLIERKTLTVFHGTSGTDPALIWKRSRAAFDPRFARRGTAGHLYFSTQARYSAEGYAYSLSSLEKTIFMAELIVGTTSESTIYTTSHEDKAIPLYLISFR
ncbi:MAG: hypothetical protein MHM6MM_003074 [Cercozoa sp. M6MM]